MGKAVKKTNAEKQILKKHVSAIHIGARLTLLQRKLVNALLYNAYETLLTEKDHTINTRLLCEMIGFESKNVTHLKKALKSHEAVKRKEKAKLDLVRDTQWQREQELERLKSEYRDLERQYREWCYERIQGAFDELPKKDREAVNEEFIERLKLPLERKEFQESGWKTPTLG